MDGASAHRGDHRARGRAGRDEPRDHDPFRDAPWSVDRHQCGRHGGAAGCSPPSPRDADRSGDPRIRGARGRDRARGAGVRHPGPDWSGLRRGELHRDARVPGCHRVSGRPAGTDLVGTRFAAAARVPRTFARLVRCAPHGDRGPSVGSRLAWLTWRARPPARGSVRRPGRGRGR
jgi:hypothetical protein